MFSELELDASDVSEFETGLDELNELDLDDINEEEDLNVEIDSDIDVMRDDHIERIDEHLDISNGGLSEYDNYDDHDDYDMVGDYDELNDYDESNDFDVIEDINDDILDNDYNLSSEQYDTEMTFEMNENMLNDFENSILNELDILRRNESTDDHNTNHEIDDHNTNLNIGVHDTDHDISDNSSPSIEVVNINRRTPPYVQNDNISNTRNPSHINSNNVIIDDSHSDIVRIREERRTTPRLTTVSRFISSLSNNEANGNNNPVNTRINNENTQFFTTLNENIRQYIRNTIHSSRGNNNPNQNNSNPNNNSNNNLNPNNNSVDNLNNNSDDQNISMLGYVNHINSTTSQIEQQVYEINRSNGIVTVRINRYPRNNRIINYFTIPDFFFIPDFDEQKKFTAEELKRLKAVAFKSLETDEKSCNICMNEYKKTDKVFLLECKHLFHFRCIKRWLREQANCPLCRQEVKCP
ncbi:hypothetical protein DMUE_0541 [Dictyocoela muelleri]|nr:hypothetical protein DMUE_0541 [Dictyocoela muelleri]